MTRRYLIINPGSDESRQVPIEQPVTQLGRGAEAAVRLPSKNISSLHASIVVKEHGVSLIDLDSTNGTQLNGRRVRSAELVDGDRIEMADVTVVYREEQAPQERAAGHQRTETYVPAEAGARRLAEVLTQCAAQGLVTAEEAESLSVLAASARRLDALYAVLQKALTITQREDLITALLTEVAGLLALDVVGLYLREDESFHVLEEGRLSCAQRSGSLSATLLQQVLASREPVLLENIGSDATVLGFESLMQLRIQSVLCLPVTDRGGEALAALYCVSRRSGQLRLLEKDRTFLGACSAIVAMALENLALLSAARQSGRAEERSAQERRFVPVLSRLRAERENLSLKLREQRPAQLFGLERPALAAVREFAARAARTDLPVLLMGETGTGKSALARHIHEQGRPGQPFVVVDCTTISSELLESELFGHEKGAFTGAYARKSGKVAAAGNGTLFIDEIGELPQRLQGKLLRLIESGEYEAVGSTRTQRCGGRLICASNRDLRREVDSRAFREDLFFRLNVLSFTLPPLRQMRELIVPLAEHFVQMHGPAAGAGATQLSPDAADALLAHGWPGNVRELENAVLRALVQARQGPIEAAHLEIAEHTTGSVEPAVAPPEAAPSADLDLHAARERLDRGYVRRAMELCGGNVSQAARKLNISRNSLMDLVKKHGAADA